MVFTVPPARSNWRARAKRTAFMYCSGEVPVVALKW
jgi:hypothetical protein